MDALAAANEQVAGFVEDGYTTDVPNGAIFRMVVWGRHYVKLHGSSDSQLDMSPNNVLVSAGSGKVYGQDAAVAAGSATFGQTNGTCGLILVTTVNNSTYYDTMRLAQIILPYA